MSNKNKKALMKNNQNLLLLALFMGLYACMSGQKKQSHPITYELPEQTKMELINEINQMAELDEKYRSVIQLGTLDTALLRRDKELSKKGDMSEYIAFTKTITRTITQPQEDSLKLLQDKLDNQNYLKVKSIINEYGYPSKERLGIKADKFAPILLHFPNSLPPSQYLEEMTALLLPEVKENRMEAISFARFYDNLVTRFLGESQKYGTIRKFNVQTMTPGLPEIDNLEETNKLRSEIGMEVLKEGEYHLSTIEQKN